MAIINKKDMFWISFSAIASILFVVFIDNTYQWINKKIIASIILGLIYGYFKLKSINKNAKKFFDQKKNYALVIAHPDDEVMFFSPTILSLCQHVNLFIVCVTKGNYYGLGKIRKAELYESCYYLGIPINRVLFLKDRKFFDHPTLKWDTVLLSEKLQLLLQTLQINSVLTFGPNGVSGHLNHIDLHAAVCSLNSYQILYLKDVNIFRKYTSCLDIVYTYFSQPSSNLLFINENMSKTFWSLRKHKSQFVWFRLLYIIFSRYVLVNDWIVYKEIQS
ncbi:N-acetylglucosaminyl-phosphatidylinositol de-N-acetylase [Hydra vulgaris]|uniref:N-acetylglucosaminylphosphatidylinositol deacetylase n=1 Tax=Hydra vulgaris TaxID=6087 RepID=A0ABM4C3R3_HYDVU